MQRVQRLKCSLRKRWENQSGNVIHANFVSWFFVLRLGDTPHQGWLITYGSVISTTSHPERNFQSLVLFKEYFKATWQQLAWLSFTWVKCPLQLTRFLCNTEVQALGCVQTERTETQPPVMLMQGAVLLGGCDVGAHVTAMVWMALTALRSLSFRFAPVGKTAACHNAHCNTVHVYILMIPHYVIGQRSAPLYDSTLHCRKRWLWSNLLGAQG